MSENNVKARKQCVWLRLWWKTHCIYTTTFPKMGTRKIRKRRWQLHTSSHESVLDICMPISTTSPPSTPLCEARCFPSSDIPLLPVPPPPAAFCSRLPPCLCVWQLPWAIMQATQQWQHFSHFSHCSGILDH